MEELTKLINNPILFITIQFIIYFVVCFIIFSLCVLITLHNVLYKEKIITTLTLSFVLSISLSFMISIIIL